MEVVLLHEFRSTKDENVRVNVSARQFGPDVVSASLSLGKRGRCLCAVKCAVLCNLEAREEQTLVEQPTALLEHGRSAETDRLHYLQDQPQQWPAVLLPVLSGCDRVVEALPLRVLLVERGLGWHLE